MKKNVIKIDRQIRVILGILCLIGFANDNMRPLWLIGLIPLITGFIGFCPLYKVIGIGKKI